MGLFCHKFGEEHGLNIRTWIRLIKGEIARRNNYPSDKIVTTDELIERMHRPALVERTLDIMHLKSKQTLDVSTIANHLSAAGWSYVDIMRLQKNIPIASKDFYNPLNGEVKDIANIMRNCILNESGTALELNDFLDKVVNHSIEEVRIGNIYRQTDYLRALGTLVYYDGI